MHQKERELSSSSDKAMVLLDMGPHPHDLTNLNYILKILYPDIVTLEIHHTNFGSTQYSPLDYALIHPSASTGKESLSMMETGLGSSPGEGKFYPLQCSGLKNSMNCIVHGVAKRNDCDFYFNLNTY